VRFQVLGGAKASYDKQVRRELQRISLSIE
jgi:hypothetical protein